MDDPFSRSHQSSLTTGEPGDSLAGKRAELEKSMLEASTCANPPNPQDKLDHNLASRPNPEELVKKGILNRELFPSSTDASGRGTKVVDVCIKLIPCFLCRAFHLHTMSISLTMSERKESLGLPTALKPIGIVNEQNTCFLNSTFQAVSCVENH